MIFMTWRGTVYQKGSDCENHSPPASSRQWRDLAGGRQQPASQWCDGDLQASASQQTAGGAMVDLDHVLWLFGGFYLGMFVMGMMTVATGRWRIKR